MTKDTELTSFVELFFQGQNIPRFEELQVVAYLYKTGDVEGYEEIGRTEAISYQRFPSWTVPVKVEYKFESTQTLRFEVFDGDQSVGSLQTRMSKIMGSRGNRLEGELDLIKGAVLVVKGIEIGNNLDIWNFELKTKKLNLKGVKNAQVFYTISRYQESENDFFEVFRSEKQSKLKRGIEFDQRSVQAQTICNEDNKKPIKITFYIWSSSGNHDMIGAYETSIEQLLAVKNFNLFCAAKKKKKPKVSGTIQIKSDLVKRYSFLEYIDDGYEISLVVGIDFTKSNGEITSEDSLHFIRTTDITKPHLFNQYQQAIYNVGKILIDYDTDKQVPVYGFGGRKQNETKVNQCFPLTFQADNVEVFQIQGVLDVYQKALSQIVLSGPSDFAPILQNVFNEAKVIHDTKEKNYLVFLILTDGQITDMDATVKTIVDNAHLPVSIIIVGVGNDEFDNMNTLDGDDERLYYRDRNAENGKKEAFRDIVQFVKMNDYIKNGKVTEELATKVLEEIPEQITSYYASIKVAPSKKKKDMRSLMEIDPSRFAGATKVITAAATDTGHREKNLYTSSKFNNKKKKKKKTLRKGSTGTEEQSADNSSAWKSGRPGVTSSKWFY